MNTCMRYIIALIVLFPSFAFAAEISLDPTSGVYGPGDSYVVNVRLSPETDDECINAVDVSISYPKDLIKASAFSKGESILTVWAEEPTIDQTKGIVHFSGGIPGGYCGRVLGDPGKTNIIGKVVFSVPAMLIGTTTQASDIQIPVTVLPESKAYLNDGQGTLATLRVKGAVFGRSNDAEHLHNEWTDAIHGDVLPPDDFRAEIQSDPNIFDGKFFLVFSTVDKQSGVSHFEVMEEDPLHPGKTRGTRDAALFIRTTSPYLLKDQTLKSKITVRAFDNAGNRKEFVLNPGDSPKTQDVGTATPTDWWPWMIIVLVALVGIVIILRYHYPKRSVGEHFEI